MLAFWGPAVNARSTVRRGEFPDNSIKWFYSVLTLLQYSSCLAKCFGFYKTIFRTMLTIGRYIQCAHTLWDPIAFT